MTNHWHAVADDLEQQAAHARLQAGREDVAAIQDLVKAEQNAAIEERLDAKAREAAQLENAKETFTWCDRVLREAERGEDNARLRREQAKVEAREKDLKARLAALRGLWTFKILTAEEAAELRMIERLKADW